jgi:hypothetical protein
MLLYNSFKVEADIPEILVLELLRKILPNSRSFSIDNIQYG